MWNDAVKNDAQKDVASRFGQKVVCPAAARIAVCVAPVSIADGGMPSRTLPGDARGLEQAQTVDAPLRPQRYRRPGFNQPMCMRLAGVPHAFAIWRVNGDALGEEVDGEMQIKVSSGVVVRESDSLFPCGGCPARKHRQTQGEVWVCF